MSSICCAILWHIWDEGNFITFHEESISKEKQYAKIMEDLSLKLKQVKVKTTNKYVLRVLSSLYLMHLLVVLVQTAMNPMMP